MKKIFFTLIISLLTFVSSYSSIPLSVLFGNPEKVCPLISPYGNQLSYCAPDNGVLNIWVKTIGKDDDRVITHETQRGIFTYWWAFNNKQILYLQDSNGNENYHLYCIDLETNQIRDLTPFEGVKVQVSGRWDKNYPNEIIVFLNKRDPKFFDAYHLDLITGQLTMVAQNDLNILAWGVDAQLQVRAAIMTHKDGTQSLLIRDSNEGHWRDLLHVSFEDTLKDDLYCALLGFSLDGNYLYLNSSIDSNARSLLKIDLATDDRIMIATDPQYDVEHVYFNMNTYEPEIVCWQKQRLEYSVLDPMIKSVFASIQRISNGDVYTIHKSAGGNTWIVGFMHDNKSFEYYAYDQEKNVSSFLFATRPALQAYELASMEPISYISRDGLLIEGYLTRPVNTDTQPLPLVLFVHGGPFTRDSWGFNPIVQWIASQGYACLQVNYRGSSGYGKQFLAAGNGQWGALMQDDLTDAVNWAVDLGIADPKRIAIFGGSYGGYAALMGVAKTPNLYCCAIDFCGPSNLITLLQTLPPYWSLAQWEQRIGLLQDEEFLKLRSPLFHSDAIKAPLLIVHGAHDVRVKQTESEQIVQALKDRGINCEYLLFPDEGHGILRPENKLTFYTAAEQFLAKYLTKRCDVSILQ